MNPTGGDTCNVCQYCGRAGAHQIFCMVPGKPQSCYCVCDLCLRKALRLLRNEKEKIYDRRMAGGRIHT